MSEEQSARSLGDGSENRRDESLEVLFGRLVDGEAGDAERARFDALAAERPELRAELDARRLEMERMTGEFDRVVARAMEVEITPRPAVAGRIRGSAVLPWTLAAAGWAALIVLGLTWLAGGVGAGDREAGGSVPAVGPETSSPLQETPREAAPLSPDEHLELYLDAANVLGELEPIVLEVEELSDGRIAVRYLRRIEEFVFLPNAEDLPVDERGYLTVDPARLRQTVPAPKPGTD